MENMDIRQAAKSSGVFLWQIAAALNVTDGTFSRKLRKEFTPQEKENILHIIEDIAQKK